MKEDVPGLTGIESDAVERLMEGKDPKGSEDDLLDIQRVDDALELQGIERVLQRPDLTPEDRAAFEAAERKLQSEGLAEP